MTVFAFRRFLRASNKNATCARFLFIPSHTIRHSPKSLIDPEHDRELDEQVSTGS